MLIRRMLSVYANLEHQALELSPGVNVLQAPDGSSRSAWLAFLLAMFYGGEDQACAAVSGRLDCQAGKEELTLLRATRQGGPALGEFRALYAGTDTPVPGLTGDACGEKLLGADRGLFEDRGLLRHEEDLTRRARRGAGDPDAAAMLEGEAAFFQVHGRPRMPALEEALQETTALLATREALTSRLESLAPQGEALAEQARALEAELASIDRWDAHRQQQAYCQAEAEARAAEEKAALCRSRLEGEGVPEMDAVTRLRGAIVNLNTTRKSGEQARAQRDQAAEALLEAETRLNENPFAGMTPEEAEARPLRLPQKPRVQKKWLLPALVLGLLLGCGLYLIEKSLLLSIGAGAAVLGAGAAGLALHARKALSHWEALTAEKRRLREASLSEWKVLEQKAEAARSDHAAKNAAWDSLQTTVIATEQGILQEVQRFVPAAVDIPAADAALRAAAVLRKDLSEAEAAARLARRKVEQLSPPEDAPAGDLPPASFRKRPQVLAELEETRAAQRALQTEGDRIRERLQAIGDPEALRARAGSLADDIAALEKGCAALSQALAPGEAGSTLARHTAQRYAQLLCPEAGETSQLEAGQAREASQAQNAPEERRSPRAPKADALALALQLVLRELALPEAESLPLIFAGGLEGLPDPEDRTAILRWLQREGKRRQILLFTSGVEEAAFFREDPGAAILYLTPPPEGV